MPQKRTLNDMSTTVVRAARSLFASTSSVSSSTSSNETRRRSSRIRQSLMTRASTSSNSAGETSEGAFNASAIALGIPTLATLAYPTFFVKNGLGLDVATPLFGEKFETIESVQHFSNAFGTDAFALVALASLYTLGDAAKNDRLKSETYQRLALSMVLFTGSFVLAFWGAYARAKATGDVGPSVAACATLTLAFAPAFATSVGAIREFGPGHDETWARVGEDFEAAKRLGDRSEKGGYLELFYKVSFWTSMVVGGSFAFSPLSPLAIVNETAPSSQLIQRTFGLATVFLLAPTQFVLIDASRRGRLGGGTFKKLNLSIAASIGLIDWMTVYTFGETAKLNPTLEQMATASGGTYNYVGALAVSATILACYLYQGVFAKK